jgi:hypothetical protein
VSVDGHESGEAGKSGDQSFIEDVVRQLAQKDTSSLEMLVTSVLESELFSIAVEIDEKYINPLPRDMFAPRREAQQKLENKPETPAKTVQTDIAPQPEIIREKDHSIRLDIG